MNVNFDGQLFAIADMGRTMCNGVEALQLRIGFLASMVIAANIRS